MNTVKRGRGAIHVPFMHTPVLHEHGKKGEGCYTRSTPVLHEHGKKGEGCYTHVPSCTLLCYMNMVKRGRGAIHTFHSCAT